MPQHAIELWREGDDPLALCWIVLTLAGTGIGRGWDTVGHAAGVYRCRVRLVARNP